MMDIQHAPLATIDAAARWCTEYLIALFVAFLVLAGALVGAGYVLHATFGSEPRTVLSCPGDTPQATLSTRPEVAIANTARGARRVCWRGPALSTTAGFTDWHQQCRVM